MLDSAIQTDLLKEVEQLPPPLQRQVVDFARKLAQSMPHGTPGKVLLDFAGTLNAEEATAMINTIEMDCERIDPNAW